MNATVSTGAPRRFLATVRHLVGFDLRRFRLLVLLIVGLELTRAAFVEWTLHLLPTVIGEGFGGTFGTAEIALLDGVLWLATVLATAILVQGDLPSDDRAFWRTRPIPPLALAVGKLATCALLFVALPWVIDGGRLLAYGAPAASLLASLLQLSVLAGAAVVPAWALAIATRTLPRFIAVGLGALVAGYLGMGAFHYWWSLWSGSASIGVGGVSAGLPGFLLDWQRREAFGWWGALLLTTAALGVLIAHYRHRRVLVSLAGALVLLAGSWIAPSPDHAVRAAAPLERLVSGHLTVAHLGLTPQSITESRQPSARPYPVPLTFSLALPQLPADVAASVFLRNIRLHGGRVVAAHDAWQCCFSGRVVGIVAPSLAEPRQQGLYPSTMQGFAVDAAHLDDLRDRTISVEAEAEVRLIQHRFAAVLPLRPGAAVRIGGRLLEVLAFEPRHSSILVRYAEFPIVSGPPHAEIALFVGNRSRNRVSVTSVGWGGQSNGVMINGPQPTSEGRRWVSRHHVLVLTTRAVDPDAELYVVESRDLGTVRTPVRQAGLRVWTLPERPVTP